MSLLMQFRGMDGYNVLPGAGLAWETLLPSGFSARGGVGWGGER